MVFIVCAGMALASILHYQRFIEEHEANARALKQNATATPESNAFWAVLKTMDDLSVRSKRASCNPSL